ncbi:MAG: alpha-1,3-mannosyltransferase family protein [Xanthobacteraceae bacterium]|nr:alpha-1,3-mannosyltransferase family protein [Xanthobacteraceae bacterium]
MTSAFHQALEARLRRPAIYPADRFAGRGIVVCAGGPRYFTCAWVLIWMLRRVHRVALPIQVWHLGRCEMSEEMQMLLEENDVEVVNAETIIAQHPARIAGGWPLKPYAIQHSRFREVLYLDADTVPLVDPLRAFDWPLYGDSGALMWPDIVNLKASNPIWARLGLVPRDHTSVEACALLFDKQRAWRLLDLAVLLNEHVEEIYSALYGDKDTFLVAALLLGDTPALMPHRPFVSDQDLVQRDPGGAPFLQHRTGSKWTLGDNNRPLVDKELMADCQRAIEDLRRRWSGVVFNPPTRSARARDEEARLMAFRCFRYEPAGSGARTMELLAGGRIGEGRGVFEQHWAVIDRAGTLVLQFYSSTRLTVELTQDGDGSWRGRCVTAAGFDVRLIDTASRQTWPHEGTDHVARSSARLLSSLIDPSLYASGFSEQQLSELRAALSLINDRYDDVPEEMERRLAGPVPEPWRSALSGFGRDLAARRDRRRALATRSARANAINWDGYERIP